MRLNIIFDTLFQVFFFVRVLNILEDKFCIINTSTKVKYIIITQINIPTIQNIPKYHFSATKQTVITIFYDYLYFKIITMQLKLFLISKIPIVISIIDISLLNTSKNYQISNQLSLMLPVILKL